MDSSFLEQVAAAANGRFFFAPTADQLRELYIEISHAIKGWQQMISASGAIAEGQTMTAASLTVPDGTGLIKVVLSWPGSDLDLILRDPNGAVVDAGETGVVYSGNATLPEYYEIYDPAPGHWAIEVYGRHVSGTTRYFVAAFHPGPLMQVKPTQWEFEYPSVRQTSFTASEVGGLADLENVTFTATDLVQIAAPSTLEAMKSSAVLEEQGAFVESTTALQSATPPTIPGNALSFTPNGFNVPASSSQSVVATFALPPRTPTGTYAGNIVVSSSGGTATIAIQVTITVRPIDIDMKPGSDPNSVNCSNEAGVIPVAILTTDTFDATAVDHATVSFEGATETHVHKKTGEPQRHEEDVDGDGDIDLVLHFRLGETSLTCEATEGTLTGETFDGQAIQGHDTIRMIGGNK